MEHEGTAPSVLSEALWNRLTRCGKKMPSDLRSDILALGRDIAPELISIVADDELSVAGAPGDGWLPVHAADLLIDMKAEDAVPALLSVLVRTHWDEVLHNALAVRLPELGPAVFEPGVALMETLEEEDARDDVCSVLAQLGVRDDRVFAWCLEALERDAALGAAYLADYGDEQALPYLRQAIEGFEPDWDVAFGMMALADLAEAYEAIAGSLPDDLAARAAGLQKAWEERKQEQASGSPAEQPYVTPSKVGRNEPCPCGSGKKFKKCCGSA
jgi:hypothetical protein